MVAFYIMLARPYYSPCATDTGKQGELDLCRYLHTGI